MWLSETKKPLCAEIICIESKQALKILEAFISSQKYFKIQNDLSSPLFHTYGKH